MFHDTTFPDTQSYRSVGGIGFATQVVTLDSGAEERVSRWQEGRARFSVELTGRAYSEFDALRAFYYARRGAAASFRFKDFQDRMLADPGRAIELGGPTPTKDDVSIGTGTGPLAVFQLVKKYTSGSITRTRTVTKPVEGTILIAVDGVLKTEGSGPSDDYTIDYATGLVIFNGGKEPALDEDVTAGGEFDVHVRFDEAADSLLAITADTFDNASAAFDLVEVIEEIETAEEFHYGGAKDHGAISVDANLFHSNGRVQRYSPQSAGLKVKMWEVKTYHALGGPYHVIKNDSLTDTLEIQTWDANTIVSIPVNSARTLWLSDLSGATEWVAT